jgi:light-regulated signal transduction histidine kinase (bacteriophytochrome)
MYNQVLDALEQAATESKQYAAELERSNRDLNDFASIASHDLHAPLRRVRSLCELLQKYKGKLDADADEFIDFIVSETNSMEALISDLLSYSRVDSHGQAFEKTDCAIVLKKTLALLDVTIQETGATITSDAVAIVNADHIQLGRVFQNLLSNAMKYCEEKPQIHFSVESKDGNYLFKVSDNGIGIPPEDASDVFVMLKRLHSDSEYAGTGIGLSICKRIVERHGGRIWVEPAVDQGSVFCFTLPIVE